MTPNVRNRTTPVGALVFYYGVYCPIEIYNGRDVFDVIMISYCRHIITAVAVPIGAGPADRFTTIIIAMHYV
jgi:hypothetical protein